MKIYSACSRPILQILRDIRLGLIQQGRTGQYQQIMLNKNLWRKKWMKRMHKQCQARPAKTNNRETEHSRAGEVKVMSFMFFYNYTESLGS